MWRNLSGVGGNGKETCDTTLGVTGFALAWVLTGRIYPVNKLGASYQNAITIYEFFVIDTSTIDPRAVC